MTELRTKLDQTKLDQTKLDKTANMYSLEANMASVDLALLSGILFQGALYFSLTSPMVDVCDYVVAGLVFAGFVLGISAVSNRFILMDRYDKECHEIGKQINYNNRQK